MTRARRNICLIAVAAAALSTTSLLPGRAAAAANARHSDLTTTIQVVATGLNVPKGLIYDREHHRLLIAEAGVAAGNNGPCAPGGFPGGSVCYGATGSVYSFSLAEDGQSGRIITGLPSISDPAKQFVFGLHDLSLFCDRLTGVFGLFGSTATRTGLGPGAADLGQAVVFGESGQVTPIADVAALEAKLYGAQAQSNLFGVVTGGFGTIIANEGVPFVGSAGGNDVLRLKDGNLSQLVAFPLRAPAANPNALVGSAPSTVVQGPDGAFYVGELTTFPTFVGEARVWRVVPGQAPTVFASGFTTIAGIAFDSRGRLLVAQLGPQSALIRVNRDGTRTVLADDTQVDDPGGIAVVNDDTIYVTTGSGGTGGDGQLVKITLNNDD